MQESLNFLTFQFLKQKYVLESRICLSSQKESYTNIISFASKKKERKKEIVGSPARSPEFMEFFHP